VKILLVVVGKARPPLEEAVLRYELRASRYWKLQVEVVDAGLGKGGGGDPDEVKRVEGERILARVPAGFDLWLLTREGRGCTSEELAERLADRALHALPSLALCIGGAFGFSSEVRARGKRELSLSQMTLPHEMARLVLAEQLYRAGTILRGEPYHKGLKRSDPQPFGA
jgi:23S rRNA (pseudouridine1915-N3)-methyltransferase